MSDMGDTGTAERREQRYYGKYAGIVMDNAAQGGGAHRGQIKVRVPGILEEEPGGGADRPIEVVAAPSFLPGFFFIPEAEAPVWVEFVAGDINFPIWTGVFYPNDAPPNDSGGSAPDEHKKIIRTPSGQVIHLDDTSGSEKLVIKDEKNKNTVTMDASGVKVECEQSSGTGTITMDSNGVTIEFGQAKLTLSQSAIELKAGATVSLKLDASSGATLEGGPLSKVAAGPSGVTVTDATGAAQGVVLGQILSWLLAHTHIGNMGAPTPLNPGQLAQLTAQMSAGSGVASRPGG
ncbi:phage baseplate assembly protein V [Sorangium sp. So ce381]|uniref:phage baseplate assembly protein V n=2 Tax=unclassified Sorangium TaxID=2621164 RepID=UPI003F5BDA20